MPSVSLAQLALRTNLSKSEILTRLGSLGMSAGLGSDASFSESDAAEIVAALRPFGAGRELRWFLSPGDRVLRADLHLAYGGSRQDGIVTFTQFPDIIAFTDPKSGARHGYDALEGLLPDGSYSYTGAGSVGPQVFKRGNRALAEAAGTGRRVRLFRQESPCATYVGEYTTGSPAFRIEEIPDSTGAIRPGIIFNLVPINADPRTVATDGILERAATAIEWTPLNYSDVEGTADVVLPSGRRISRDEFKLQTQFGRWIADQGHAVRRLLLPVDGVTIEPDLFVESKQ
ncbi:hypothetical protein [Microbacterium paludicola]|uniref:hypothetical protein n=1 Tax=Microbacterium paludicola TaxID=300019 RepID=UPI0031D17025